MIINSPAQHGPRMQALIDHPTTLRQVDNDRQAAKAFVEMLIAWLRDTPDCPHDNDEAVAEHVLRGIDVQLKMRATADAAERDETP